MSDQNRNVRDLRAAPEGLTTADLLEQIGRFAGPPEQFLLHLLKVQCEAVPAEAGAVVRPGPQGMQVVGIHPPPENPSEQPPWLARCAEAAPEVIRTGKTQVLPLHDPGDLYGQPPKRRMVVVPLGIQRVSGVAAFVVDPHGEADFLARRERLEFTRGLLALYEMYLTVEQRSRDMGRLRAAMETLAAVNEQSRFAGAAMALCNEVASRWQGDRVGLGFLRGRYVELKALSHTEKFSRKMKLVQDVEAAMEECLDQDVEVVYPSAADAAYVSRAAKELSTRHGPTAVVCMPLRQKGDPLAVLSVERPPEQPFTHEELEALRLTSDLCTARLVNLHEHDRWFGARAAAAVRGGLSTLVGPKHTWAKLGAVLGFAAILFLVFAKGTYRVDAPFVLEATRQQVIPAPFDGYIKSVSVEAGDLVEADKTVLATIDTAELRLELGRARAELAGYLKQSDAAMRDGKTADAQIAQAQADRVRAQMQLLEHRIGQADVTSPLGGTVVTGELKRRIGAPVKTGDVLFEVAPLESLRAVLSVPEDLIADVIMAERQARAKGEEPGGELATARHPDRRLPFVIERINPVAEVVNQKNVFKVRVRLSDLRGQNWMQPGMEGAAKIDIETRRYAWIWTRRLINWLRMKLWV